VQHQVQDIARGAEEEDFEDSEVEVRGEIESRQQVNVAGAVDEEVEELRFEGYAGCALPGLAVLHEIGRDTYRSAAHFVKQDEYGRQMRKIGWSRRSVAVIVATTRSQSRVRT